jgi:hypothetical protein
MFGQIAIIGQQQQALSILIQSPNREQTLGISRNKIDGPRASGWITIRAQNTFRLVQEIVLQLRKTQTFPVQQYDVGIRLNEMARIDSDVIVDRDTPVTDVSFTVTT